MKKTSAKILYLSIGWFFTILAFIGVFLPVLPTTPFLLISVWAFSRSSDRLRDWLFNHPKFGPYLNDWFEQGAIDVKAKTLSITLMSASFAYLVYKGTNPYILAAVGITIACIAVFILTRPNPERGKQ